MVIERIQAAFPKLRKSEQKAASYMLNNTEKMEKISLGKIAKEAEVSEATVIRMLKAVGYGGSFSSLNKLNLYICSIV